MVHIVLPIQFKKRYAPYLLIGQTEMMQIVYLLHIGEVFHQEELEIRRNCTGIYLREDAVLPQRCTDLFLVQRVENGKSIYGIDANCCKERIQKLMPGKISREIASSSAAVRRSCTVRSATCGLPGTR